MKTYRPKYPIGSTKKPNPLSGKAGFETKENFFPSPATIPGYHRPELMEKFIRDDVEWASMERSRSPSKAVLMLVPLSIWMK